MWLELIEDHALVTLDTGFHQCHWIQDKTIVNEKLQPKPPHFMVIGLHQGLRVKAKVAYL